MCGIQLSQQFWKRWSLFHFMFLASLLKKNFKRLLLLCVQKFSGGAWENMCPGDQSWGWPSASALLTALSLRPPPEYCITLCLFHKQMQNKQQKKPEEMESIYWDTAGDKHQWGIGLIWNQSEVRVQRQVPPLPRWSNEEDRRALPVHIYLLSNFSICFE